MTFTEATSSGKDFRRVGEKKSYFGFDATEGLREYFGGRSSFPSFRMQDFLTGEFEFVEDEVIEVGDTAVRTDLYSGRPAEEGVIHGINHQEQAVIIYKDNKFCVAPIKHLKLIRKGNVHVFEGVQIIEQRGHVYTVLKGSQIHPAGYFDLRNDDKTYKMTLTEEDK